MRKFIGECLYKYMESVAENIMFFCLDFERTNWKGIGDGEQYRMRPEFTSSSDLVVL